MRKIIIIAILAVDLCKGFTQAPGTLNKNFGSGGIVKNTSPNMGANGTFYAVQAENCFVLGNGKIITLLNLQGWAILAQRLPGGGVDSSYGKNGFSAAVSVVNPVAAIQPDGKILIVGTTGYVSQDFIIARMNTNGTLDGQFGNSGVNITDGGSGFDVLSAVAIAPNGQIIAGGQTIRNNTTNFALIRYTSAGKVDGSFGQNGIVFTNLGGNSNITSLAFGTDSKIIAAGNLNNGTSNFAVARYKTSGAIDTSFNHNGISIASPGTSAAVTSVAVLSGKIITGGYSYDQDGVAQFDILQLTVSGAIDSAFGTYGWAYANFGANFQALTALKFTANGRILTAGYTEPNGANPQFALAKFLPSGIPDSSFGTFGQVLTSLTDSTQDFATSMSLQSNGEILLGGYSVPNNNATAFSLVRYQSNGTVDNGFALNGVLVSTYPNLTVYFSSIGRQHDGKLVVFGGEDDSYPVSPDYLYRYTPQGAIDPTYGQNGRADVNFLGFYTGMQSDDKMVIAGYQYFGYADSMQVVRYLTNGNPDPGFGTGGLVTVNYLGGYEFPASIAIQTDNKTLIGGYDENSNGVTFALVARFNTNGTVDPSFGNGGVTSFSLGFFTYVQYIAFQSNGKILLAGTGIYPVTYQPFSFCGRMNSNGAIDSTFGQNGFIIFDHDLSGGPQGVFPLSNGKILFGYYSTPDYFNDTTYVTRFNANGSTDSSYGNKGSIIVPNGRLALEPDQKLLVTYNLIDARDNSEFVVNRYLVIGSLDLTFGNKGSTETLLSPGQDDMFGTVFTGNELAVDGTCYDPYGIGLIAEYNLGPQTSSGASADITVPTDVGACSAVIRDIESLIAGNAASNARFSIAGSSQGEVPPPLNQFAFNKGLTHIRYFLGSDTTTAGEFTVNVVDQQAPLITPIGKSFDNKVSPDNFVDLRLNFDVADNCGSTKTTITFDGEGRILTDHSIRLSAVSGIHTIRVTATDESGNESFREDTVMVPASILKADGELNITAYPNPAVNFFSVHIGAAQVNDGMTLQLFNDKGELVETINRAVPWQTVKMGQSASSGVYFLKAIQNAQVRIIKLVKI